jgi:hypothetical protein
MDTKDPFIASIELQIAVDKALASIGNLSYSERHPELGRMKKCYVCGTRHRENEKKCEQVFTYTIHDYEYFRENDKGELVPDYRTCMRPDERATRGQVMGRQSFAKKRLKPHPSRIKLILIEKTRAIFSYLGFSLDDKAADFQENLQRCRVLAARDIRREREESDREYRRRADVSKRINKGLL